MKWKEFVEAIDKWLESEEDKNPEIWYIDVGGPSVSSPDDLTISNDSGVGLSVS